MTSNTAPTLYKVEHEEKFLKLRSFDEYLYKELRDPEFAASYLEDALKDSLEEFFIALRKYVQANGGMSACAEQTHLAREAIYRMLSADGNPELRSIDSILKCHGLRLSIQRTDANSNQLQSV